ncbi:MAG: T9SS type A sorting domain-containing protein [Bacteroidales bacterium]|nr:T9SS type A sorting domain-containing protein [Bacteroidales bacterium]
MKKQLFLLAFCLLSVGACFGQPRHYGDTIYGRNPNYFYQWWPDEWYALDSVGNSLRHLAAESRSSFASSTVNDGLICLDYMYTPRGINIIGLAVASGARDEPWQQESVLLYDARPDTLIPLQSIPWHISDSCYYMNVEFHNNQHHDHDCCIGIHQYSLSYPIREYYFDRPVYVEDSFYVGRTLYSWTTPNSFENNIQASYGQIVTWGCDSCPVLLHHRKIYGLLSSPTDGFGGYTFDNAWHDMDEPAYGMVFAIYRDSVPPPCAVPTGFRAERRQDSCLSVCWDADTTHLAWELSFGVLGSPRDRYTTVMCDSSHHTFCGLSEDETYAVYVRGVCNDSGTLHSDWSNINLVYLNMPLAGTDDVTPNDGITLRPNPADKQVTVSAVLPLLHVEVYDLAGRLVETRQPSGTALQLDLKSYPTGTYLVKVTTATGTTTKKLVVK